MMVRVKVFTDSATVAAEGFKEMMASGAIDVILSAEPDKNEGWPKKAFFLHGTVDHRSTALEFLQASGFSDEYLGAP